MFKTVAGEVLEEQYAERLIKLSTMVSDNRISEANARIVFHDIQRWHTRLKRMIEEKL